jgi:predicted component of type VI protein secretion system
MKVTKSVVLDDEQDAALIEWSTTRRISFSAVVRQALYEAMRNDRQPAGQNDRLDAVAIRQAIRAEIRAALNGLALAAAPPVAAPEVEDALEAALDNLF